MLQREQIDFLLVNAYNAALRAGAKIMEIYDGDDFAIHLKADNTPTTLADREAHRVIKEYLAQTRIPLLSEEGRDLLYEERCHWDLFWMIDPLDGTREFIKRESHEFTVNIALMVNNEPFIGVVYAPYYKKMYFCDRQRGSFSRENVEPDPGAEKTINEIYSDAVRLPVRKEKNSPLRITVSRLNTSPETYHIVSHMRECHGEIEVVETGSSLKFCLVAEGSADYYIRTTNTYEWDTAAGNAILTAAGAKVFGLPDRQPIRYNKGELSNPYFICKSKFIED